MNPQKAESVNQAGVSQPNNSNYTWSPTKPQGKHNPHQNNSIMAVSKAELIEQLSSVKSFVAEHRQKQQQMQGFSEYAQRANDAPPDANRKSLNSGAMVLQTDSSPATNKASQNHA